MECRSVINSLSNYIDGRDLWLASDEISALEKHLDSCINCLSIKNDLTEIKTAACELPLHTPTKALWHRIAETVEAELPKSERPTRIDDPKGNFLRDLFSRKFSVSFPQLAGASAVLLFMFGTGIYSSYQQARKSDPIGYVRDNITQAQSALLPDESQLIAELERKLKNINAKKASWHPIDRESFDKELGIIENKLTITRDKLKNEPSELSHKQLLRSLYEQKRKLLEDVERLNF